MFCQEETCRFSPYSDASKVNNILKINLSLRFQGTAICRSFLYFLWIVFEGDKVKVTVRFRGREADYAYHGDNVLKIFVSKINEEIFVVEKRAKLEGRNMTMVLSPKKA